MRHGGGLYLCESCVCIMSPCLGVEDVGGGE